MRVRDPRLVAGFRLATVLAVLAGIVCTAAGPPTVTGLLPYFTIQSNVAYGLFAGYAVWRARRGEVEPSPLVKGAVTLYVTITGTVYHLVLANPASPFAMVQPDRDLVGALGNQLLHTVVPLLAVVDWAVFDTRGRYRWRYALYWLAFPLAYLAFALLRGLVVHRYPYPFINAAELGYDGVAVSTVVFAVTFWVLGCGFVGTDRGLARRHRGPAADPAPAAPSGQVGSA